jgi:hypothetical protein
MFLEVYALVYTVMSFRGPGRQSPGAAVFVGSHGRAEAVLVSVKQYGALLEASERRGPSPPRWRRSGAKGLYPCAEDLTLLVHVAAGQMTADELRERILAPPEVNGAVRQDPHVFRLRNLLGIADAGELAKVEAALSAWLLIDLERRRLQRQQYDLDHLQAFHRYIVHDVFGWAGELRTVSIAKGSLFCLPKHFAIAAGNFLAD